MLPASAQVGSDIGLVVRVDQQLCVAGSGIIGRGKLYSTSYERCSGQVSNLYTIQEKETSGIRYLEREGDGIPLVLLHGIGSNALSFTPLINALPPGLRLIAWHAPGYASSTALDTAWPDAADYADALAGFLDALELPRVNLLGHSLGTLIASAFAVQYADRVRILLLASCANGYGCRKGEVPGGSLGKRIADLEALGAQEFAKQRAHRLVFEPHNHPAVVDMVEQNMSMINPHGYAQAVHMLATGDLVSAMQACKVPTRFIVANQDEITPEAQTLAAAGAWAQASGQTPVVERIDNAGHAVYLQQTAAFAETVKTLIR